jgi:hypothetical protein
MRDPERYHLTIYGRPSATGRVGLAVRRPSRVAQFHAGRRQDRGRHAELLGANPANVPRGPKAGFRVLAAEEDEARALLASLTDAQRREAVFESRTYGDIVTSNAAKVDPLQPVGIAAASMTEAQRTQLVKLVEVYATTFEQGLAQARMARVKEGGVEKIRFGWAGATERGKPHYYRVQGPLFLIEYDASQDGGNHIHSVWRDFTGDFGRDLLREHYENAKGTAHRH